VRRRVVLDVLVAAAREPVVQASRAEHVRANRVRALGVLHEVLADLALELLDDAGVLGREDVREGEAHDASRESVNGGEVARARRRRRRMERGLGPYFVSSRLFASFVFRARRHHRYVQVQV
jgi:hypothetical protein